MAERKTVRCAIYTRVSTDAGLEQDFNSLDAQREAAEAYIKSQAHEGWILVKAAYDDGGFSGGTLERPALQRLLQAVRVQEIDVIVVYKVDRLTRSLADFAKLVELFDQHTASFVSVTQSFNTTTSMGRLTLNVLLSFAQFEREVTAERIRDKISASKKKGIWVGGNLPFGYRAENRKLVTDPKEAEVIKMIFRRYIELGSLLPLLEELHRAGVKTRRRVLSSGKEIGGVSFTRGLLSAMLKNRIYIGEINHHGKSYPGEHEPILDVKLFDAVQERIFKNTQVASASRVPSNALLKNILFDDRGNRMSPTYSKKNGVRYRYYASRLLYEGRGDEVGKIRRISAVDIEDAVMAAVQIAMKGGEVAAQRESKNLESVRSKIKRVEIHNGHLLISLVAGTDGIRKLEAPWNPKPGRPRREILLPHISPGKDSRPIRSETRVNVACAVAMGRSWLARLISDPALTVEVIATRENRSPRSVQMHLSLNFLAPDIVGAILAGKLPRGIGITKLINLPAEWKMQRHVLGLTASD